MSRIAPLIIQMAIHYYTTPGPYSADDPRHANSPAVQSLHESLVLAGLLQPINPNDDGTKYVATDALKVYIEALCAVPFPVQKWVIPES